ncbi:MAG TPA: beta-L-arabinofuranosidase domain-containing protein [Sedimentisphaerales bacterium]|nr:beta-L-arabinofuranosidase domain-containing protein [Sedimentisphaerales bacterium]
MKLRDSGKAIVIVFLMVWPVPAAGEMQVGVVKMPPADKTNSFYVSNRPPLEPSPLIKLPIGSIKAKGWLRRQLELETEGTIGHLTELSKWCKAEGNAWLSPEGEGHSGWEELPYWLKGFGDLGYVLKDERIIKEARVWIEGILSSQREDGWFGPRLNLTKQGGRPDLWPNMIALNCLQSYYEYTGDKRVLCLMTNYFRWQLSVPDADFLPASWQKRRAGNNLESVYWLYNRTGEKWLLDVAQKIHEHTDNWTDGIASWHGVNIAQCFRQPGVYYVQAKDPRFIRAAERNYETVMGLYGQVPGGMFGADENCRKGYDDPRQGAETCSIVEFMHSFEMLLKITGNPLWADRCEYAAFNSFPASRPPNLKGLHYLTAPNMIQLDRHNKSPGVQNRGCMLAYSAYPETYRCCQHNVSHGWPYYAEELWLATPDNGLCASLYCACEVEARVGDGTTVKIVETTEYPFSEKVTLKISTPRQVRFPLYLRIPRWCREPKIKVNGKPVEGAFEPLSYAVIEREWASGDAVEIEFPARIAVYVWEKNKKSVSVNRGPLTFSLKIGEKWVRYDGNSTNSRKWVECGDTYKWPAYEVYPTTPWNYGLVVDPVNPANCFEVVRRPGPVAGQPFTPEAAPIELRAKARKLPEWTLDNLGLVGKLPDSPVRSEAPIETVTLIPMGCARLRISAFPTTGPYECRW